MQTFSKAPRVGVGPHAGAYRPPAMGRAGVVAAAHGLAATAGVWVLFCGGGAPAAADATAFSTIDDIDTDVRSATVPGLLAGWLAAHERFGRLERSVLFQ